jgi:hypothetical protein
MLGYSSKRAETSRLAGPPSIAVRHYVFLDPFDHEAVIQKLNERTGNVYENKGALWKTWERSWNLYENKGDTRR